MTTKISLSLPDRIVMEIKRLADEHETTQTEIVRRAISLEEKLERLRQQKARLLIEYPDGSRERWDPFHL